MSTVLVRILGGAACAAALGQASPPAQAQMFHLYLQCQGHVFAGTPPTKGTKGDLGQPVKAEDEPSAVTVAEKNDGSDDENSKVRFVALARRTAKSGGAHLELALRDNNMTAFVQRSNVLPVGERMKYVATNTHYAATYQPQRGGKMFLDFKGTQLFKWYPPFEKLAATRVSIDRQSGDLEGEMVGPEGEVLGRMDMNCQPRKDGEGPAPRF